MKLHCLFCAEDLKVEPERFAASCPGCFADYHLDMDDD